MSFELLSNCAMCNSNACNEDLPICKVCLHRLNGVMSQKCGICGKSVFKCKCRKNENIRCLFHYSNDFTAHSLIYHIKSVLDERFMDFIAEMLFLSCGIDPNRYDAVTFVPRKPIRKRIFGHDQAEELAKAIKRRYGIPVIYTFERIGGRQQKTLSARERFLNIKGRYRLRSDIPNKKYNRILLVDDLCTTGATVKACAKLLRESISREVGIMVIAEKN